jgi:fumarate reductase flavoprotein subunit
VRFLYQTVAKKLLTREKGNIIGVLAATRGKEIRITAKSVIIATGGYAGNKELLSKYYPSYSEDLYLIGFPHMGEGLLMATEIGAATEGLGTLQLCGPCFRGSVQINTTAQEPNTIWVNKRGERFVNEAITWNYPECANALDRQPDKISYTLFDEKIKQNIVAEGTVRGIHIPPNTPLPELEKDLRLEANKGNVKISNSWDEMARWIGVAPEVLKAMIDEYNSFCDHGHDEVFVKDRRYLQALCTPPYYGIKCCQGFYGTVGGIKINHHMEVLDHQDSPIQGLYAAGNTTGGWEPDTYNLALSGFAFGFAINSGRIAGENAARYILGK